MMPARASACAYATLPSKSARHMRLSNAMLLLNASISGSVLPVKRPPHSFAGTAAAPDSILAARLGAAAAAAAARHEERV